MEAQLKELLILLLARLDTFEANGVPSLRQRIEHLEAWRHQHMSKHERDESR